MIRWLALLCLGLGLALSGELRAATYPFPLLNGDEITGEAMGPDIRGVLIKKTDGTMTERIGWTNFSQTALKNLQKALPKSANRFIEPLIEEEEPVENVRPRAAAPELKFTEPTRMERPNKKAGLGNLFDSPLTIVLFLLLYGANIYAGYEVSKFRNYAPGLVCGVSAAAPVIGQIIFLSMPTHIQLDSQEAVMHAPPESTEAPLIETGAAPPPPPPPPGAVPGQPTLPPPAIYARGTTVFNRRFFETKLAAYMRVVPGDAEKDMVICVKAARGEYVGHRISKVLPNELMLQINKGGASSEVTIPYAELFEVKIRHKDDV